MIRLYTEIAELAPDERAADRSATSDQPIDKARKILSPFDFEVAQVAWWSACEIGQRVCDAFDDVMETERGAKSPRIFIAGDVGYTLSPKAGQVLNVSMADAFNLGWKSAAVLRGKSGVELLDTYSKERRAKAQELMGFDREMARLFIEKPKTKDDAARSQAYFMKHGRYTAGVETHLAPSMVTGDTQHQKLAKGYPVGKRFHSGPVIRLADAKPMQFEHALKADRRWRIIAFVLRSDMGDPNGRVATLCESLTELIECVTSTDADVDVLIDVWAVFQRSHREIDFSNVPRRQRPQKDRRPY